MIKKVNPSELGLDNKGIEDIFFTEAYDTFLEYLKEQSIECFDYVDDENINPKIANITEVPIKEYSFHYIYADLYKQKEKDIISLFGRMIKLNCQELNYIRSAHHFLNDLYEDKLTLGKPRYYNFSIIFELDYIKITCEDSVFNLSVKNNEIIINLNKHTVKFDRCSCDISDEFKSFILETMNKTRIEISRIFDGNQVNAKYICDRLNKSLMEIYIEQKVKGLTIKCPYQLVLENGFKKNVKKSKYGSVLYKTPIYNEAVVLINSYLDKTYASKLIQLMNLLLFLNSVENEDFLFTLKFHHDSKYKLKYTDIIQIQLLYKNIDITISFGSQSNFFISNYFIINTDEKTKTIYEKDNDLNSLYMAILNEFRKRVSNKCEIDESNILKEHLDLYRMTLI